MILTINDLSVFKKFYEIPLINEPMQDFFCFIDDIDFHFKIQTFVNDDLCLTITDLTNNKILCQNSIINLFYKNYVYFSDFKKGAFFFEKSNNYIKKVSFNDFGTNVRLIYGSL